MHRIKSIGNVFFMSGTGEGGLETCSTEPWRKKITLLALLFSSTLDGIQVSQLKWSKAIFFCIFIAQYSATHDSVLRMW